MTLPRPAALVLGLAAAVACTTNDELCPVGTRKEADLVLRLTPQEAPGTCRITQAADGGAMDAGLFPGLQGFQASLCSSQGSDGGMVWLATATFAQASLLGDGGTFSFGNSSSFTGTACGCPLAVTELIEGRLVPLVADAGVAVGTAGLTPIGSLEGLVTDLADRDPPDGGAACRCNLPCATVYDLAGARR